MKVKEFVSLVNSMGCGEFSDVPEDGVELVESRVGEIWSFDDAYSTAMNVYECEDGYAGVIGVCHYGTWYFEHRSDLLAKLPHCIAVEVVEVQVPTFMPKVNKHYCDLMQKCCQPL